MKENIILVIRRVFRIVPLFFCLTTAVSLIIEQLMFPSMAPLLTIVIIETFLLALTTMLLVPFYLERFTNLLNILVLILASLSLAFGILAIFSVGIFFIVIGFSIYIFIGLDMFLGMVNKQWNKKFSTATGFKAYDYLIFFGELILIASVLFYLVKGPVFIKVSVGSTFGLLFLICFLFSNPFFKSKIWKIIYFITLPGFITIFLINSGLLHFGFFSQSAYAGSGSIGGEYDDILTINFDSQISRLNKITVVEEESTADSSSSSQYLRNSKEGPVLLYNGIKYPIAEGVTKVYYGKVKLKKCVYANFSMQTGESYLSKVGLKRQYVIQQKIPDFPQRITVSLLDKKKKLLKRLTINDAEEDF